MLEILEAYDTILPDAKKQLDLCKNSIPDSQTSVAGLQLQGSEWTVVLYAVGCLDYELASEAHTHAQQISQIMTTDTLWFMEDDTSCIPTIEVFSNGASVMNKSFDNDDEDWDEDEVEDYNEEEHSPPEALLNIFTERNLYLPLGYYEGDGDLKQLIVIGLNEADIQSSFSIVF